MTSTGRVEAAHQRVDDPGGSGVAGVHRPGDHLDLVGGRGGVVSLAGVEATVGREVRIDRDPHQPGLTVCEQVAHVGGDRLDRAVGQPRPECTCALGEEHGPVGRECQVPGDREAGHERLHVEARGSDVAVPDEVVG